MIVPALLPVAPQAAQPATPSEAEGLQGLSQAFGLLIEQGGAPELSMELPPAEPIEQELEEGLEEMLELPAASTPLVEAMRADLMPLDAPVAAPILAPMPILAPAPAAPEPQMIEVDAPLPVAQASATPLPVARPVQAPVSAKPEAQPAFAPLLEAQDPAPEVEPVKAAQAPVAAKPDLAAPTVAAPEVTVDPQGLELPDALSRPELIGSEDRPTAVKSPEAPEPVKTTTPLVRNVMERLSEIEMQEGKTRILLRPQGLGVLEIDMVRRMDGQIQLAIRVENPLILEALRQEGQALESFMGERGFDLSGGGAQFERYSPPRADEESDEAEPETVVQADLLQADRLDIVT